MKRSLPINIDVLKWSRESMGLSIEDVATKLKKEISVVASWEDGSESPTYAQLEYLAYNLFKRPVAVFFFPDVPKEDSPKTDFRTLPDTIIDALPSEIIKLYRKSKVFQLNIEELYEGRQPSTQSILNKFSLNNSKSISDLVEEIRNFLGISFEDQFSWQSFDQALKNWRNLLEQNGIFIFKDAFKNDNYSGFCVYSKMYPIIYLNNSMSFSRQIFTVFHELAHLLLHKGGIDFRDCNPLLYSDKAHRDYEIKCNQFANEFLVPSIAFDKENLIISEKGFDKLAEKYSVSKEVILRKCLDRKKIDDIYYKKMTKKWQDDFSAYIKKDKPGGNYYYTHISYLGDNYINLAFSKYYQNKISVENLSEFLNIKIKNIGTLEHYVFN
ncbi:MAG: ImmA/IrrE family metallo-endopeptidase [Candidatus Margulisiibacteriota bacterium]|jgi:Zn-dependent peptidase ImmA (M78 family)